MKNKFLFTMLFGVGLSVSSAFAQTEYPVDVTSSIANHGFDDGATYDESWINSGFVSNTAQLAKDTLFSGSYAVEAWVKGGTALANKTFSQTLTNIPNGKYTITVSAKAIQQGSYTAGDGTVYSVTKPVKGFFLFAGNDSVEIATPLVYKAGSTTTYANQMNTNEPYSQLFSITTTVTNSTLTLGMKTLGTTANWVAFDQFALTYYTTAAADYYKQQINELIATIESLTYNEMPGGYSTKSSELITEANDIISSGTEEELLAEIDALKAFITEANNSFNIYTSLSKLFDTSVELQDKGYPGLAALKIADDAAYEIFSSSTAYITDFQIAITNFKVAFNAYKLTQVATEKSPADYTFLISAPNFTKEAGDETLSTDRVSTNWHTNNIAVSGDFRLNTCNNKNCWNNWSNNFTSMEVYQDLNNLPEGYYSISCVTATNGIVYDQHAFATSTVGTTVSNPPSAANCVTGTFATAAVWETINTGKVLVSSDGKLRIGMASTSGGTTSGWFCCTDFVLSYYGNNATIDSYKTLLNDKIATATSLKDSLMLVCNQNYLAAGIAAAEATDVTTIATIQTAFNVINAIIDSTQTAISNLKTFKKGSYTALNSLIVLDEKLAATALAELNHVDVVLAADSTTENAYKNLETELAAYVTFCKADNEAIALSSNVTYSETARAIFNTAINEIVQTIVTGMTSVELTNAGTVLAQAIAKMKENSIVVGNDASFLITNPSFDATAGYATGWMNNGFISNTALITLDPLFSGTYCVETWVAGGSKLADKTFSQTLVRIPNGEYTISVAAKAIQQGILKDAVGDTICNVRIPVTGTWFFAGNDSVEVATPLIVASEEGGVYTYSNEIRTNEAASLVYSIHTTVNDYNLTIGMKTHSTTANWIAFDNFSIVCNSISAYVGVEEVNATEEIVFSAYVENGVIKVAGTENYTIRTLGGLELSKDSKLNAGIYLVTVNGNTQKIAVVE